jgi:hypothetical protein
MAIRAPLSIVWGLGLRGFILFAGAFTAARRRENYSV